MEEAYKQCFQKAVSDTGFTLTTVVSRAGSIDDHIRVDIRRSRFVIADLSHDNNGAYCEAGFAEGLGKPVIYTCEREKFEKDRTHFDTDHQRVILWSLDKLNDVAQKLKGTIRNTLPSDAKMEDD